MILPVMGIMDIGQLLIDDSRFPFLKMAATMPIFRMSGNFPVQKHKIRWQYYNDINGIEMHFGIHIVHINPVDSIQLPNGSLNFVKSH